MPVSRSSDRNRDFDVPRLAHDEGRRANAHANEERKRVLPDGIVPSDAHLQVELVDNETSDVVAGFPELFTIWSCEELVVHALEASPAPASTHCITEFILAQVEAHGVTVCDGNQECIPQLLALGILGVGDLANH